MRLLFLLTPSGVVSIFRDKRDNVPVNFKPLARILSCRGVLIQLGLRLSYIAGSRVMLGGRIAYASAAALATAPWLQLWLQPA